MLTAYLSFNDFSLQSSLENTIHLADCGNSLAQ